MGSPDKALQTQLQMALRIRPFRQENAVENRVAHRLGGERDVAVGEDGALGNAGGARGVDDRGRVVSFDVFDARLERMLKHLYVEIDATDAQKEKLAPIVKQAATDLLPLRDKMRAARQQAIELLAQDSVDRGAIEQLRAEQLQLASDGSKRLVQALADAAEVLNPEQRKALAERMQHRRRWH